MNRTYVIKILIIIAYFVFLVLFFEFISNKDYKKDYKYYNKEINIDKKIIKKEIIIDKKIINGCFVKDWLDNIRLSVLTKEFENEKRETYELSMIDFYNDNKLITIKIIEK